MADFHQRTKKIYFANHPEIEFVHQNLHSDHSDKMVSLSKAY